jgi:hypothetical protein
MCFSLNALLRFAKRIFNEFETHHTMYNTTNVTLLIVTYFAARSAIHVIATIFIEFIVFLHHP